MASHEKKTDREKTHAQLPVIFFAGLDSALLHQWECAILLPHQSFQSTNLPDLLTQLTLRAPDLLVLDEPLLSDRHNEALDAMQRIRPQIKILLMEAGQLGAQEPLEGLQRGVRGFCDRHSKDGMFTRAVEAVLLKSEVWIQRKLILKLIDQLTTQNAGTTNYKQTKSNAMLASLSPRELAVAQLVAQGNHNKAIANALSITERTVKSHLSAIFRKLNINSRLHLAIFFR